MKNPKIWIPIVAGVVAVAVIVVSLVVFLTPGAEAPAPQSPPPAADAPAAPPRPEPPTDPQIEPPPLIDLPDIPSSGGAVSVDGETVFHFIPDESGIWIFTTSENDGDPMVVIYNQYGVNIAEDDNSADPMNAKISIPLDAGHRYTVHARFHDEDGSGSYMLTVELEQAQASAV